jgi:hypothetical protein
MTSLQFSEYKKDIIGKKVDEGVIVNSVNDDGNIDLKGPWSPTLFNVSDFCVVVSGVPRDQALQYNSGRLLMLEASIYGLVGDYNYYYNCENTLILRYINIE